MSRKTISIRMPVADAADRNADAGCGKGRADPFNPAASDAESDRWIGAPAPASRYATIDLSAERTLAEVLALSFALPSALAWFWLGNCLDRWRRLFAA